MPLIIPMDELVEAVAPSGQIMSIEIRNQAANAVLAKAVELNVGKKAGIVVRDAVMGSLTDADITDFKDVESYATAYATGHENWAEDATDITANDLSPVIAGAGTQTRAVKSKATIGCYGFFDLTVSPDLTAIRFKRGSNTLDFWQVEQCYIGQIRGGMINSVIIWEENDPLQVDMNFLTSADKFVGLNMIVAERYDEVISAP
ncbi:MAG: hypothetical protein UY48_C0011G0007 [Candidatus Gottesmanbacteria bacterium GW2011_GWB1_49_7]|uniref:Uncharacterized protein n=1 Tax=Candidatus Gottesmanbacteria bacterium GW2011_GWB1_49_7 TaxID=1618448 RepID=A0A0G1W1U3_9BACT|nr:MAG: hypothetical protein UY48_C0011G0007 [Candidatus Gottesmanbacteria bacterium GW2011_GWB1_49_7]